MRIVRAALPPLYDALQETADALRPVLRAVEEQRTAAAEQPPRRTRERRDGYRGPATLIAQNGLDEYPVEANLRVQAVMQEAPGVRQWGGTAPSTAGNCGHANSPRPP
jgi:hypothetical protein